MPGSAPGIVDWLIASLLYLAVGTLLLGTAARLLRYARTPAPYKIPVTPAPITRRGVALRLLREVVLFESLFKASKWTWLFGWLFHAGMLIVLLRHLRFITNPVWGWVDAINQAAVFGGWAMIIGLVGLWMRRLLVDRIRYISAPSDHLMLGLILTIALSGALMQRLWPTDILTLQNFTRGLRTFDVLSLPHDPILLLHIMSAAILMLVFPISKLLHGPGQFFSPTRYQVDNPRERRHGG